MLAAAGVAFTAVTPAVDEAAIKARCRSAGRSAEEAALALAAAKADDVADRATRVIGADQILVSDDGAWFDKPTSLAEAAVHLRRLRGRVHRLVTAIVVTRRGEAVWSHLETPTLTMRAFSEAFLADYLAAEGDMVLASVGAYRIEGRGLQLFEQIEGERSAIMGLPLLPLLRFLRADGAIAG